MKIVNNYQGSFYVAIAPYNSNSVLILDTGEYGALKVLANASKYFLGYYYPEFYRVSSSLQKKKLSDRELKQIFIHSLDMNYKWTVEERENLAKYFNLKLDRYLKESKNCQIVKGRKVPNSNKRVKPYARKRK
jgi:hypothetical protein